MQVQTAPGGSLVLRLALRQAGLAQAFDDAVTGFSNLITTRIRAYLDAHGQFFRGLADRRADRRPLPGLARLPEGLFGARVGVFLWPIAVAAALFMRPNWPALVAREKRDAEERDAALREFEEREAKRAAVPDKPRPRYPGYS